MLDKSRKFNSCPDPKDERSNWGQFDDATVNNGYVICDIDGNGNLDSQDYGLSYNNANLGANVINPFSYLKKK